jgi:hypothetical protein
MLHKCANPACSSVFRRLSEGKLFQVEMDRLESSSSGRSASVRNANRLRRVEHYWLCNQCSSFLTLTFERGRGVTTVPLPSVTKKTVAAASVSDVQPAAPWKYAAALRGEQ